MGEYKFNLSQSTHKVTLKHTSYEFKLQHVGRRGPKGDAGPSAVWGDIDGNIVDQSDLQAALALKASLASLAPVALSGDYDDLNNLPALYNSSDFNADFGLKTTTDLAEGSNQYFTDARAIAAVQTLLNGKQPLDVDLTALANAGNSSVLSATTASFLIADETKLDGIEALADVTDAANVLAAGAVMITGSQTITGIKTFGGASTVFDDPASSATVTLDYSGGIPRIFSGGANNMYFGDSGGYLDFAPAAAVGSPKFTYNRITATSGSLFRVTATGGLTGSGSTEASRQYGIKIDPTINQSGGAHSSMLLIDPTVTALGSGTQYLIDARAGGVQRFNIDHNGSAVLNNSSGDALRLNGTGSNSTLLRLLDDGTERGAIFSTNASTILHIRSQGELRLTSNNGGTAQHITINSGTVDVGSQTIRGSAITLGPEADTFQTVLTVRRNAIDVGRIDNNGSGFRLQSLTNALQLRASDNMGINITAASISFDNKSTGFFGAIPVAKPTGVAVSAAGIHAALVSLGLIAA